jgi:hypothetical protein
MPIYNFHNKDTGEITERFMSIASMEQFLVENPHMEIHYSAPPAIGDTVRMGMKKTPESFRHLLKNISKRAGRRSTVNYD